MLFQVPFQLLHQCLAARRRAKVVIAPNMKYPPFIYSPKSVFARLVDLKENIQQRIRERMTNWKESGVRRLTDQQLGIGLAFTAATK
jgi:hypothetical protein